MPEQQPARERSVTFIQYLGRIQFGGGARSLVPQELDRAGVRRPLVVSDRGLEASGVLAIALEAVPDAAALTTFLDVPSNPTEAAVLAGLDVYRRNGCDGVLAIGGGSALDCGKAIALLATHGGPLSSLRSSGERTIGVIAPVVAVPTTAGTGSEIGRGAGITMSDGVKEVFLSEHLVPVAAVCDPELTLGLPPRLTAATGIDAFTHALEAYASPAVNPPADAIALDVVERLHTHLPRAVADGSDRDARWNTMMGSLEAAMTTWKGLGATHALSVAFDDLGLHHGTVVGVLLPFTVPYLLDAVEPHRLDRLVGALGTDRAGLEERLSTYRASLGLPSSLRDLGAVPRAFLRRAAEAAEASAFNRTVPRRLTADEYEAILERAL